jgi:hypothetical protein
LLPFITMMFRLTLLLSVSATISAQECTLCPAGDTGFNAAKLIPFSGSPSLTCSDLETQAASILADDALCRQDIRINAAWCECPGVPAQCTVCPDGSIPPNLDRAEPFQGFRCSGMEYFESLQTQCGLSTELLGIDTPSFCGCPDVTPPGICQLCPGGQVNTETPVSNFLAGGTCGEVADFFLSITNATLCSALTGPAQQLCCAEGYTPPVCTVCQDGSDPMNPVNTIDIPGEGSFECQDLTKLATNVPATFCSEFQETVKAACCEELKTDDAQDEGEGGNGDSGAVSALVWLGSAWGMLLGASLGLTL